MRRISTTLLVSAALGAVFVAGCNSTAPVKDTRAADEAVIRAASKAWSDATKAKDLDKTLSFYSNDAIQMTDQGPNVLDKIQLRAGWQTMLALPGPGLTFQTTAVDVAKSGDIASEYGTYDFAVADSKGKINDQKGKFVVIWKKQSDGSWKAAIDINNTDGRPPAPHPSKPEPHHAAKHHKSHH